MVSWGVISASFVFVDDMVWGPIAAAFGTTDAELTFYLLRFLLGAAEAGFFPGVILYLTFWFPAGRRAEVVALFMTAIAVSNVIGSPLSGAILQFSDGAGGLRGWEWLFVIEALPSVLLGLLFLAVLPDGPRDARWLSDEQRALVTERLSGDEAAKQGGRHTVRAAFADLRVWAFAVVYFCTIVCLYAVNFWMPTIVQEMGIDPADYLEVGLVSMIPWGFMIVAQVAWARQSDRTGERRWHSALGLLSMIPWGFMIVAQVLWARHSDRTGERRWHCALGLLVALAGLLMLAVGGQSVSLSLVGLTLVTVGTGCALVTFWSLPPMILSGVAAAAGIAWINSVGNLGGHFGPDLIGRVREASGGDSAAAFLVLAGLALVGAAILLAIPIRKTPSPS